MVKSHFNLKDEIFLVSLDSISRMPENPVVVGGAAIQLHARDRPEILRSTPDIDLTLGRNPQDYAEFTELFFKPALKFLNSRGYAAQSKKGRLNNAVKVIRNPNKPDEKNFLINLTYYNPGVFDCLKDYLAQQVASASFVSYAQNSPQVKLSALEEVLPLKLQRAVRYGIDRESVVGVVYPTLIDQARSSDWQSLASMPLEDWKPTLSRLQEKMESCLGKCDEARSTYKLSKDIYDICLAARVISDAPSRFNQDRYEFNVHRIVDRACSKHSLSE